MDNKITFKKFGVSLHAGKGLYSINTLKRLIDLIQKLGYNTLYLEISINYEIKEEPFFAYMRPRYSVEEMKEIDSYGKEHNITVIPIIQTLAHLKPIFKWRDYRNIEDKDGILLVGEPRTYVLIENMIKTLSECFSSKVIHLSMDEAFSLGRGKYYDLHGDCDRVEIMREHISRVLEITQKYGVAPEMWGDMYFRLAYGAYEKGQLTIDRSDEVKKIIPSDLKIHYWDYYSTEKSHYVDYMRRFEKLTNNYVFDGAAWNYIGFIPDNDFSIRATKAAFEACDECGVEECVITTWGDTGGETSIFAIMPTLICASEFARGNFDMESIKRKFNELVGIPFDEFMKIEIADRLKTTSDKNPHGSLCDPTRYMLYSDVFNGFFDTTIDESEKPVFSNAADVIAPYTRNAKWGYIFKTIKALDEVIAIKYDLGLRTRKAYQEGNTAELKSLADNEYTELIKKLEVFYKCFQKQWYTERKQGGFEVHDHRLGGLIMRVTHCKQMLSDFVNGKIDKIEELDQKLICYRGGGENFIKGATTFTSYEDTITSVN